MSEPMPTRHGWLFEQVPGSAKELVRSGGPETSREAAEHIMDKVGPLQRWAARCVREAPGSTARELAQRFCPGDPKRIDRRLNECERLGMVARGEKRRCRTSGRSAVTWWVL